jgi:hypothetical protein
VKTPAAAAAAAAAAPTNESAKVEKAPKRKCDTEGESSANKIQHTGGPKSKTTEVNGKHTDDSVSKGKKTGNENGSTTTVNGENRKSSYLLIPKMTQVL